MTLATTALSGYQFTANVAGVPVAIGFADLPEVSQLFVVEYGLKQYVQDGAAVAKKDKDGNDKHEDDISREKVEGVQERIDNLHAGEFTRRSSAIRLTPEEKERNELIMAGLQKFAKAQNKSLPSRTGKKANPELLDKMMTAWYGKNKAEIDKEVARRLKAQEKSVDVGDLTELAELFA